LEKNKKDLETYSEEHGRCSGPLTLQATKQTLPPWRGAAVVRQEQNQHPDFNREGEDGG